VSFTYGLLLGSDGIVDELVGAGVGTGKAFGFDGVGVGAISAVAGIGDTVGAVITGVVV